MTGLGRCPVLRQCWTAFAVQTRALGRVAGGSSACAAGLKSIKRWLVLRIASLSALRSVARMRCMVAGLVTRWRRTAAWRSGFGLAGDLDGGVAVGDGVEHGLDVLDRSFC